MMSEPAYLRLSNAPSRFDVSEDTIRRWEAKGYISIYRRGGIALVKVAETILAHQVGGKVERTYARSDMLEKRRPVMEAWGRHCAGGA